MTVESARILVALALAQMKMGRGIEEIGLLDRVILENGLKSMNPERLRDYAKEKGLPTTWYDTHFAN